MDFNQVFDIILDYCRENSGITDIAFNLWIKCIKPVSFENDTAVLFVSSDYQKRMIETKSYHNLLKEAFKAVLGFDVTINVISGESSPIPAALQPSATPMMYYSPGNIDRSASQNGEYEYTFETFIVGSSNKFAHAACVAVAEKPSGSYNPLFIYGGSGLGKTHLLNAIENHIRKKHPEFNIVYVKGEEFTNELIATIPKGPEAMQGFHDKYRSADVLLMDDIQFIGGKEQTQEEFFHTFNTLYQSGKQIVLTSDRSPKEIKTLEDRLRTRFEWGLLADVQKPDFETRVAIIRRKAELLDINIPDDVCEFIANRLKNNIRQLEGAVKKLKAYKLLAGSPPTIALAQNAIRDILNDNQPVPVTVERIINEVARTFSVTAQDIRSNKRSAQISNARQAAIYVVREITQMSMASIGEEFGGRDHSTMVYAIQQVTKTLETDSKFKETIEDIIKNIRDS